MLETFWEDIGIKDPLFAYRKQGWELFQSIGLPTRKQEAFQYLNQELKFRPPAQQIKKVSFERDKTLVFVDGFLEHPKSSSSFTVSSIEEALSKYGLFLQQRLKQSLKKEKDPFAALNGAFFGGGAFLYIPPKASVDLEIVHLFTKDVMATPRLHIYVGREAALSLHVSSVGKSGFANGFLDFVLDQNASCTFKDFSEGDFQAVRAQLKKDSFLKLLFLGKHLRNSVHVDLLEENTEANLFSLVELEGKEQSHIHAQIEHVAPHARSRQHIKSVLKDHARFSFEGKIYVHKEALKTEAYQLNNNLILSDEAEANAKPNLEIFADDVKASHGATTGKLDEEELFYLRSRGLSDKKAKEFLIAGFCKEILAHA